MSIELVGMEKSNPFSNIHEEEAKKLDFNGKKTDLSSEDYFKLLVAQYTNQNPMEPIKEHESIAAMVQMTSVGQMRDSMKSFEQNSQESKAIGYLGKQVHIHQVTKADEKGRWTDDIDLDGVVTEVSKGKKGEVLIRVAGQDFPVTCVTQVQLASPAV